MYVPEHVHINSIQLEMILNLNIPNRYLIEKIVNPVQLLEFEVKPLK